jgi:hypothetical protein
MQPNISDGYWVAVDRCDCPRSWTTLLRGRVVLVKGDLVFVPGSHAPHNRDDFRFLRKLDIGGADPFLAARVVTVQFTVTAPSDDAAKQAVIQSLRDPAETGHRAFIDSWEVI